MRALIILGSSRNNGDTAKVVDSLIERTKWDLINLNDYEISYYDYEHKNRDDDFIPLMDKLTKNYDTFIIATPVYWYSMSAVMKAFFDRLSDLLSIEKELGRKLRGKNMSALSSSVGGNLGDAFWLPFIESANYLGMNFLGGFHNVTSENENLRIDHEGMEKFINEIKRAK
jgi:multimeric flavodoxin WrbA